MHGKVLAAVGAIAARAAGPQLPGPAAEVSELTVNWPGPPELRISVPKEARYVGGERFVLYGNADCELQLFVEADSNRHVHRLYWVQFESYLPTVPDAGYTYGKHDRRSTLWGQPTWISSGFGKSDFATRPGSDREHLRFMLKRAGYQTPPTMMQVRMVRLLDDPAGTGFGRRELMLIYAEDLNLSGENFEALGGEGEDTDRWRAIEPALIERAANAFTVSGQRTRHVGGH